MTLLQALIEDNNRRIDLWRHEQCLAELDLMGEVNWDWQRRNVALVEEYERD